MCTLRCRSSLLLRVVSTHLRKCAHLLNMPKQVWKIDKFHGGINSNADPRDIADNQFAELDGVMVDEIGTIRTLGSMIVHPDVAVNTSHDSDSCIGLGLFTFSHDRQGAEDMDTSATEAETNYIAISGTNTSQGKLSLWSDRDGWDEDITGFDMGSNVNGHYHYYYADGDLRVFDGNPANTSNKPQSLSYMKRGANKILSVAGTVVDGWEVCPQAISGDLSSSTIGTKFNSANQATGGYATEAAITLMDAYYPVGLSFNGAGSLGTSGTWGGYHAFYYSVMFNKRYPFSEANSQESKLTLISKYTASSYDKEVSLRLYLFPSTANNPSIVGVNIYIRKVNSALVPYGPAYLLIEASTIGDYLITTPLSVESTTWATYDTTKIRNSALLVYPSLPTAVTYEDRNGYPGVDSSQIVRQIKTAVVANRIAYVGNVHQDIWRGDAIIKSPVNELDVFPSERILESAINDGDAIIKLEEYADRILQFKKTKLTLINVSQEIDFIEEVYDHKGVANFGAVTKTDAGVAWVNENGCFFYDGKSVTNLLTKKGVQIIDENLWASFISDESLIGYNAFKSQLIICKSYDDASNNDDAYIFDMVTRSWITGSLSLGDEHKTNFRNFKGDLIIGRNSSTALDIMKWSDTSVAQTISIKTKDFDFGQPAQRKKIYKVYITYQGDGSAVTVGYRTNGENTGTPGNFYKITSATDGSTSGSTDSTTPLWSGTAGTTDWLKAELKPVTSINNVNSFQIVIGGTAAADFKINSISIIFRMKGLK